MLNQVILKYKITDRILGSIISIKIESIKNDTIQINKEKQNLGLLLDSFRACSNYLPNYLFVTLWLAI